MYFLLLLLGLVDHLTAIRIANNPAIHFHLHRRGSRFSRHEPANLTRLAQVLAQTEEKYSWTYRDVQNNRLVRRWDVDVEEHQMFDRAGLAGNWYFNVDIGQPSQSIEVDLDMLCPDFYSVMTTSAGGTKFDSFLSQTHVPSQKYAHPVCRLAKDIFGIDPGEQIELEWPICQASHSTRHTLQNSGTILGVAPQSLHQRSSLSRIDHVPLLEDLYRSGLIPEHFWSITLLDSNSGILSLGGTVAKEMEVAKARPELELKFIESIDGQTHVEDELRNRVALLGNATTEQFKWLDVHSSGGWWTGLISGIWINEVKIMKNQPFLLDINCPYILAPSQVFGQFYKGVSGSRFLDRPYDSFAAFPCLNPPRIALELAGWQFPVMQQKVTEGAFHGPAGGRFSLGKLNHFVGFGQDRNESNVNSGFCIGTVVKTSMGERTRWQNSGLKGVWVLGEPFFQSMGVVLSSEKADRIGFRSY